MNSKSRKVTFPEFPSPSAHRGTEALERVQRMLDVTGRMLRERAYHEITLDAILKESGGSKATLRKYFGNKAGLFGVLLRDEARKCIAEADEAARDQPTADAALRAFAMVVLKFFCRPDAVEVYRAAVAEVRRTPEFAERFYYGGYRTFIDALAALLEKWHEQGVLELSDASSDAERFLVMLRSGPHDRALLGVSDTPTDLEIDEHVKLCTNLFLRGVQVNAAAKTSTVD